MRESEPSYYEISLTNRQVLIVFTILLGCLVVAFFSGVWVGHRGLEVAPQPQTAEVAAEDPGEPRDDSFGELNFFSDKGKDGAQDSPLKKVAAEPSPNTTLLEDLKAQGAPIEETAAPPPAVAERAPAPAPQPSSPAVAGGFVIQVFSSEDQAQAGKLNERLRGGGYPAFVLAEEIRGRKMYRVRIGPYADRAEAQQTADKVKQAYKLDTWITR